MKAFSANCSAYCYDFTQATLDGFKKTTTVVNDINGFTKIFRLVMSAMKFFHSSVGTPLPLKLFTVFDTANLNDFYEILSLPKTLLFPVTAERIDTQKVFERLLTIGQNSIANCEIVMDDVFEAHSATNSYQHMHSFVKKTVQDFVSDMQTKEVVYRNTEEFFLALAPRLSTLKFTIIEDNEKKDFSVFKDQRLYHPKLSSTILTQMTWSESLLRWNGFAVASECALFCLKEWKLIQLNGIEQKELGIVLRASVCSLYALKALILFNDWDISQENTSTPEPLLISNPVKEAQIKAKKEHRLADRVNVISDLTYHSANLVQEMGLYVFPERLIPAISIFTNMVGLKCIWSQK